MPRESRSAETTFGYLSTLESPEHGHFGGYLIVSPLGRPREFHCTSPVRPNRAQAILYGPTLESYLIGEQITGALLSAAKLTPKLILTESAAILAARSLAKAPMAWVLGRETEFRGSEVPAGIASSWTPVAAGGYALQMPTGFEAESNAVVELANILSQHVDLAEPFGRIHEAIREAQRIGGRAAEDHGQAA